LIRFDPYDYALHDDPYPTYARLREEAPLYRHDELDFWALSRHADVTAVLRDTGRYSTANGVSLDQSATGDQVRVTASFLAMDAPQHTRLRAVVARGFTPRLVRGLEPRIRDLARQHLRAALDRGSVDLVADLAAKLPMDVISELIGVPATDRDGVRRLADQMIHREEGIHDIPPAATQAVRELLQYYAVLVSEKRHTPGDDLTSELLATAAGGDRISERELVSVLFLLGVAGNETTTRLLGNAWYWAWRYPEQRAHAYAGHIEDWIEETLRFAPPTHIITRTLTETVELHGTDVPAGSRVALLLAAANRDPRVFADPDRYQLGRDTSRLVTFGHGPHFCLGAPLARLEARVMLEEFVDQVDTYDIDEPGLRRVHSVNVAGIAALPATLKPR
jgi:cytochrome P450